MIRFERPEVVGKRVRSRVRVEADVGRDRPEQRVACDEDPVTQQREVAVRMPRQVEELPAVELLAGREQHRIAGESDEVDERSRVLAERLELRLGRPVLAQVLRHPLLVALLAPGADALGVVVGALVHRRPGQRRDVGRRTDVVGVEVGDDDSADGRRQRGELPRPPLTRIRQPEAGVHEGPAAVRRGQQVAVDVVDAERQREGDPPNTVL